MNISFGDVLLFGLMLVSLFLMFVILLQRGRGGGLAGAFGGLGGQSAFGTKAGDVFTVITIVTVIIWVILSCLTAWRLRYESSAAAKYHGEGIVEPAADEPDEKAKGGEKPAGSSEEAGDQEDAANSGKKKRPAEKTNDQKSEDGFRFDDEPTGKGEGGKPGTDSGSGARKKSGARNDGTSEKPEEDSSGKE